MCFKDITGSYYLMPCHPYLTFFVLMKFRLILYSLNHVICTLFCVSLKLSSQIFDDLPSLPSFCYWKFCRVIFTEALSYVPFLYFNIFTSYSMYNIMYLIFLFSFIRTLFSMFWKNVGSYSLDILVLLGGWRLQEKYLRLWLLQSWEYPSSSARERWLKRA